MSAATIAPAQLFGIANLVALAGWAALALGIGFRSMTLRSIAGVVVPVVLSVGYAVLIAVHWSGASGGFASLADVAALFQSPWMLLAGWVHYLAFDLFVGAWIAGDAQARGLPRLLLVPVLPVVFLFGPAGLLLWFAVGIAFRGASELAPRLAGGRLHVD